MSRFISAVLVFCVIATSGMAAALRVDTGTGQFVTICSGGQSVTVELDAAGAPVEDRHRCPDCMVLAVLDAPAAIRTPIAATSQLRSGLVSLPQRTVPAARASARAPPVLI